MGQYTNILIFIFSGVIFCFGGLFLAKLLRPHHPNDEKLENYESGELPIGLARGKINIQFYVLAIIFILFEVEIIFLFPWVLVFTDKKMLAQTNGYWAWVSMVETFIFIGLLIIGLVYVWKKGYLDWKKPMINSPKTDSIVPYELYQRINKKYD